MKEAPFVQITIQRGAHSLVRYRGSHARNLQKRIEVQRIEHMWDRREWPRGVYAFTTLDGMTHEQLDVAKCLWARLRERPDAFAPLNDPNRVIGRYALLRKLHGSGVNDFNVHRLSELNEVKFPAFVRYENLHRANLTDLLHSQDELDDAIAQLLLQGERQEDMIVTEWLDYRDDDGLYRKFGAHIAGDRVLAKHLFVADQWMLKMKHSVRKLVGDQELEFVRDNPHESLLRPVFEASGCNWARVDYSFYKGRLQVWEVNDNPEMGKKWRHDLRRGKTHAVFFPRFDAAIDEVSKDVEPGPPVVFSPHPAGVSDCV